LKYLHWGPGFYCFGLSGSSSPAKDKLCYR
jgi:hypothetical protein